MKYVTPSSKDVEAAEAQIRQDYAQYGQATAHPAKITKAAGLERGGNLGNLFGS